RALVADGSAGIDQRVAADVDALAEDRALDPGAGADVAAGVDHRAVGRRAVLDDDVVAEHRVRLDAGAGVDPAEVADVGRTLDLAELGQLDAVAEVDVLAQADARDLEVDLAVERVVVRLAVLLQRADVLPVAVGDPAVQRPAALQQVGEQL